MTREIYLDNAATSFPKPECVYEAMDQFYRQCGVNIGRGQYRMAEEALKLANETRELLIKIVNGGPNHVAVIQSSATEALNTILLGHSLIKDDVVYHSPFEHNAVLRTLEHLRVTKGIVVKPLSFDKHQLQYDLDRIEYEFINLPPKIVVLNHVSNVCGLVAPVHNIFRLAKSFSAVTVLDAAQSAGLIDIDMNKMQIDYLVYAGHKLLYGPFGIGGFITSRGSDLQPLVFGGTGVDSAAIDMPSDLPGRFEAGSSNISAIAGLNVSLKWVLENQINTRNHIRALSAHLFERLSNIVGIRIHGTSIPTQTGIYAITVDGYSPEQVGRYLATHQICTRSGLHCAPNAHKLLGTYPSGTVRISLGAQNKESCVDMIGQTLESLVYQA